ncbi:MAG: flagellar hook assembly protein FlgD [Proteobacteria bacterium]|nr:flagellar hook assembly protein FlgD [Burkholderiales bacterium]
MSSVLPAVNSSPSTLPRGAVPGDLANTNAADSQDRFLKLLVTQMRNQDPLNPMDNAQVTTQLAQISTVNGIDKLNTSLNGMADAMAASSSLQNASLIGRSVVIPGNLARFDGTTPVQVGVELAGATDRVNVAIVDASGNPVRQMTFGALPQGTSTFDWDGRNDAGDRVAAGDYLLKVDAADKGKVISAATLVSGRVDSISVEGANSRLNLRGLGTVEVAQVRRID